LALQQNIIYTGKNYTSHVVLREQLQKSVKINQIREVKPDFGATNKVGDYNYTNEKVLADCTM
jgi:hypothetical protein